MNHHVFVYVAGAEDFMTDQANPVLPLKSEKDIEICVDFILGFGNYQITYSSVNLESKL